MQDRRTEVQSIMMTLFDNESIITMFENSKIAEGRAEGMEKGMEKGRAERRAEGANLLGALISKLIKLGRNHDIERVATDSEYRQQLYKEFQIA